MSDLRSDALFKGCARPAMKWGVPVVPLGASFILFLLGGLYGSMLVDMSVGLTIWLLYLPVFLVMRQMTKHDEQAFRLYFLRFRFRFLSFCNGSARFWRSMPYAPMRFERR